MSGMLKTFVVSSSISRQLFHSNYSQNAGMSTCLILDLNLELNLTSSAHQVSFEQAHVHTLVPIITDRFGGCRHLEKMLTILKSHKISQAKKLNHE